MLTLHVLHIDWRSTQKPASAEYCKCLDVCTLLTSLLGLRLRQLGLNLLTWRTWMAHLMLRWWSWLVTLRNNKSFWGGEKKDGIRRGRETKHYHGKCFFFTVAPFWSLVNLNLTLHKFRLFNPDIMSYRLTTVRYCSICPSTLPSLNWSLYWGRPMSSSQPGTQNVTIIMNIKIKIKGFWWSLSLFFFQYVRLTQI